MPTFREYLLLEGACDTDPVSLRDVLKRHSQIASDIAGNTKVLTYFYDYLEQGYYPFFKEVFGGYGQRVQATINQVLENDLPSIEDVSFATIQKTKKMLVILAAGHARENQNCCFSWAPWL